MSDQGAGHRQRLKDRFNAGDPTALTDLSLLELLLTYAIPRADVQPLAQTLLARFGSLDSVLSAPVPALHEVKGLGDAAITLLKLTHHIVSSAEAPQPEREGAIAPIVSRQAPDTASQLSFPLPDSQTLGAMAIPATVPAIHASEVPDRNSASAAPAHAALARDPSTPCAAPDDAEIAATRWRASGRYTAANMLKPGLVPEITLALQTYDRLGDLAATRRFLQDEGLPQRSRASRTTVVQVFRDRLMTWNPPSWVLDDLIRAANESNQHDLLLLLLLHTARQDVLLYEIVQRLIVPRWREGMTQIGHNDVQAFLDQASPTHPEVTTWTRETRSKLAGNILTVLRDYGVAWPASSPSALSSRS